MGRDLDLPRRLRRKGLNVVVVGGFETRGLDLLDPVGSINHHTAGGSNGVAPSLNTCIYGRGGSNPVPGPLCNVMQGRHPTDPMLDPVYVIASGKANHAGKGTWRGYSGNSKFYGLEVEHTGLGGVHPRRLEVAARIHAAFLEGAGARTASLTAQHFEYATPPGRKIDFFNLTPFTAESFRARVTWLIGRDMTAPTPPPPIIRLEPDMDYVVQCPNRPPAVILSGKAFVKLSDLTSVQAFRGTKDMQFVQLDSQTDFDALDRQININTNENR
jgi:hypothetical protein